MATKNKSIEIPQPVLNKLAGGLRDLSYRLRSVYEMIEEWDRWPDAGKTLEEVVTRDLHESMTGLHGLREILDCWRYVGTDEQVINLTVHDFLQRTAITSTERKQAGRAAGALQREWSKAAITGWPYAAMTVKDLIGLTQDYVLEMSNMGISGLRFIQRALSRHGLKLEEDASPGPVTNASP